MLPQTNQDVEAQKKAEKEGFAKDFAPSCIPTNWERDSHPAYEGLDPGLRDFMRNRYKHWAPKVTWIFRLWYHLGRMNGHLAATWLMRTQENSDADVIADRKKRAVDYFWDGVSASARSSALCLKCL